MVNLLLCVLMNVGIFTCFRLFTTFKIDTLQAIVFNYVICVLTGFIFTRNTAIFENIGFDTPWLLIAIVLGAIFMGTFYLMAITTQKFSMTVSSIAAKMSLVVPVLFSLFILEIQSKPYTWINYAGMVLAVAAIFMSSYKERKLKKHEISGFDLLLPFLIFILGGIIDSLINYTNFRFLTSREASIFPLFIFSSAAIIGTVLLIVKRRSLNWRSFLGGVALGIVNYFSIYFLLNSLTVFENDGAIVYPLVNVGIIIFSSIISLLFFREKLSLLNKAGLFLAIMAIVFISYQELSMIYD